MASAAARTGAIGVGREVDRGDVVATGSKALRQPSAATRDVEQTDRLVAQLEAGGKPRRLCVGGFRRDQRVPHVVGERVEEGVEPFGHWVPFLSGTARLPGSGRAPWDCDQGSDRLVTTAPSGRADVPGENTPDSAP